MAENSCKRFFFLSFFLVLLLNLELREESIGFTDTCVFFFFLRLYQYFPVEKLLQ